MLEAQDFASWLAVWLNYSKIASHIKALLKKFTPDAESEALVSNWYTTEKIMVTPSEKIA